MNGQLHLEAVKPRLRLAVAFVMLGLLAGCGVQGDFGRVRPSLAGDDVHAWLGPAAVRRSGVRTASTDELTDDERQLRDLAYPLIEPPYDRNKWDSVLRELGYNRQEKSNHGLSEYASRLLTTAYRSQTARYNRLIEDIRNDVLRIDPFFASARYVLDMDSKREKSLAYVSSVTKEDRANALRRIAENRAIVQWVENALQDRAAAYKIALERMVVTAPSPVAVEAERALTLLNQRISGYSS